MTQIVAAPATLSAQESSGDRRDARTRVKLREAELNLGRYRDALVPHVKAAVEKAIGDRQSDPAALWLMPDIDRWRC